MFKLSIGFFLGISLSAAVADVFVSVPTNGRLKGYVVQDAEGKNVCEDPLVFNGWLGEPSPDVKFIKSYIVCQK